LVKGKNIRSVIIPYIIHIFFLLLLPGRLMASGLAISKLAPVYLLSRTNLILLLSLIAVLVVLSVVVIFFWLRLKRANSELRLRNSKIEELNLTLERTNHDLEAEKDSITKVHYESDRFLSMLLHAADDGISFYDRDWNLKFANNAFYSIIGYDREAYHSKDTSDYVHPDDKDFFIERIEGLKSKGFHESELRLRHREGHYVILSSRSVSIRDENGEVIGALTISRDITKMKQIHEDLIKANVEAETSNRLKASFLANISHEIRTPLNSVVGFSNLLLSNDLPKEVREEYIGHINHNSEKLLQIIGDIIDLSRLESGQIEITYEESSVNEIVNEVVEDARQIIRRNEKPIILNVKNQMESDSDLVFTDRVWLKRVLTHLMDNAVKFTLDGSIEIFYKRNDNDLIFIIKDTGIGINKENLKRIFEEFRQEIDGHHRPFEGLGIGLTLAKEVLERMGGKINVESEKGIGSEFSFSIPYRAAASTRTKLRSILGDQSDGPVNWSSRKCLLVDDNKDVIIYLSRILLDTGIEILSARSGIEALGIIKGNPEIDIVLLDMQMPGMNGIETTKEIRKIRKVVPIIAQTAFIFEDDKDIILEAGCDACLIKPIRKEHLLAVMSSFVK
jgi:PAS domain S-box-containing protein